MPRARVPDEDAVRFGAIVTRLRMERGWTLADLSRLSGLHATCLGVLERSRYGQRSARSGESMTCSASAPDADSNLGCPLN